MGNLVKVHVDSGIDEAVQLCEHHLLNIEYLVRTCGLALACVLLKGARTQIERTRTPQFHRQSPQPPCRQRELRKRRHPKPEAVELRSARVDSLGLLAAAQVDDEERGEHSRR